LFLFLLAPSVRRPRGRRGRYIRRANRRFAHTAFVQANNEPPPPLSTLPRIPARPHPHKRNGASGATRPCASSPSELARVRTDPSVLPPAPTRFVHCGVYVRVHGPPTGHATRPPSAPGGRAAAPATPRPAHTDPTSAVGTRPAAVSDRGGAVIPDGAAAANTPVTSSSHTGACGVGSRLAARGPNAFAATALGPAAGARSAAAGGGQASIHRPCTGRGRGRGRGGDGRGERRRVRGAGQRR
jgi:hypothetical protein